MSAFIQAIPSPVLTAFWPIIALGILAVIFWRLLRWFRGVIREEFKVAIEGRPFQRVVDERVSFAFQGAIAPIMSAHGELAGKIAVVERTANRAHDRIDKLLRSTPDEA